MDVTHLDGHKVKKPVSLLPLKAFGGWLEVISAASVVQSHGDSFLRLCSATSPHSTAERPAVTVPQMFLRLRVGCTAFGGLVLSRHWRKPVSFPCLSVSLFFFFGKPSLSLARSVLLSFSCAFILAAPLTSIWYCTLGVAVLFQSILFYFSGTYFPG